MTFSTSVKHELCSDKYFTKHCCQLAFLYGVLLFGAKVNNQIKIQTEHDFFADKLNFLFEKMFGFSIAMKAKNNKRGKTTYHITLSKQQLSGIHNLLPDLFSFELDMDFLKKRCDKTAFLRGAFLMNGFCNNPDHTYQMEFTTPHISLAQGLYKLIETYSLHPRLSHRKNQQLVYLKDSDEVFSILNILGASGASLRLMEAKVIKDVRNNVNRKVNFETANLMKTAEAAALQIEAIQTIQATKGLEWLPEKLRELARLRLENPEMSLSELGELINPKLSRSGVNHRLQKIMELAKE